MNYNQPLNSEYWTLLIMDVDIKHWYQNWKLPLINGHNTVYIVLVHIENVKVIKHNIYLL